MSRQQSRIEVIPVLTARDAAKPFHWDVRFKGNQHKERYQFHVRINDAAYRCEWEKCLVEGQPASVESMKTWVKGLTRLIPEIVFDLYEVELTFWYQDSFSHGEFEALYFLDEFGVAGPVERIVHDSVLAIKSKLFAV